jgi:hypothetical protein
MADIQRRRELLGQLRALEDRMMELQSQYTRLPLDLMGDDDLVHDADLTIAIGELCDQWDTVWQELKGLA